MFSSTDEDIADVLSSSHRIALVGASRRPESPSYRVMAFLLGQGYEVYPVNPLLAGQQLQGQRVYASLADVPGPVDMVDVFRQSRHLPEIVDEALACCVPVLWTQLGVVHEQALLRAEAAGVRVVADRCPAIEIPRLSVLMRSDQVG